MEKESGQKILYSSPIEFNGERESEEGRENILKEIAAASKVNVGVGSAGENKNEQATQYSRVY